MEGEAGVKGIPRGVLVSSFEMEGEGMGGDMGSS